MPLSLINLTKSVIFITLNKRASIARAYFSEQYMNVTVEKYDLTEKTNEKIFNCNYCLDNACNVSCLQYC